MNPRVEFDLSILKNNIIKLQTETSGINFLFPVKCCNHVSVLELVANNNFGFDVSNMNEFKLIEKYLDSQIVSASGPLSFELLDCKYHNIHVVSNNFSTFIENNGIRINFNSNNNFSISRFGVDYKLINEDITNKITYVHVHNSDHKNLKQCQKIYDEIQNIIKFFPSLKILNIGGHLEDLSFEDGINYLNKIKEIVPNNIKLYVELGDFLFKNVGTLYSKIIDIRKDKDVQFVTLNFSKMANQRWAYPTYTTNSNNLIKTIFFGCSCCETDIYLETEAEEFVIGDEVVFKNISPYSYQWDTSFNGVEKMEYIFK